MTIKTERLTLVPVDMSYAESTYAYAGDIENTGYMMHLPFDSVDETKAAICRAMAEWPKDDPKYLEFAIIADGRHIGGITLYFLNDRTHGELGWVVHKDHWRKGYATEAARGIMEYAKTRWGMTRIIACCDSENVGSKIVMEKLGMKYLSTGKRKNRSSDEERIDLVYEIYI